MSNISPETMGRIAIKMLARNIAKSKDGFAEFTDVRGVQRNIPNFAKEIDEKPEDLVDFHKELLPKVIGIRTGYTRVSLSDSR